MTVKEFLDNDAIMGVLKYDRIDVGISPMYSLEMQNKRIYKDFNTEVDCMPKKVLDANITGICPAYGKFDKGKAFVIETDANA